MSFPTPPVLWGSEGRGLLRHPACFGSRGQSLCPAQGWGTRPLLPVPAPCSHPRQGGLSPFQICPSLPRIWLLRGFYAVGGSQIAPHPLDRPQNANTGQARIHLASQQQARADTKRCQIPQTYEGRPLCRGEGGGRRQASGGEGHSFPRALLSFKDGRFLTPPSCSKGQVDR